MVLNETGLLLIFLLVTIGGAMSTVPTIVIKWGRPQLLLEQRWRLKVAANVGMIGNIFLAIAAFVVAIATFAH